MSVLLVTGPSAFIGRHALAALSARAYDIHALCRNPVPEIAPTARWHAVDLMDRRLVHELCARLRPTYLLHMAWCASNPSYRADPANDQWANASKALASAFFSNGGKRAVFAGTSAEYEAPEKQSPYVKSKITAAQAMQARARACGGSFAWGRIFLPYGPDDAAHRLVPSTIDALLAGRLAQCSAGDQVRDFVYAGDVGAAFALLLESKLEGPNDVGTGCGTSVRHAVEEIARQVGRPDLVRFGAVVPSATEPKSLVARPEALLALHWQPRTLSTGLGLTIAWHRARLHA